MGIEIILSLLFFVLIAWYVTAPLLSQDTLPPNQDTKNTSLSDLKLKKNEVLLALKDLEMDFKMQKISKEDYQSLYNETFEQGKLLLEQIEATQTGKKTQKNLSKLFIFLFCVFLPLSALAQTSTVPTSPHTSSSERSGFFEGFLFTKNENNEKAGVSNHPVTIIIYQNNQQVLTIDKNTDSLGRFTFKNIIKTPDFAYEFGTVYQNNIYIYSKTRLRPTETTKNIDFFVGNASPYKQDSIQSKAPPSANNASRQNLDPVDADWFRPFKIITLILCGTVVLLALYFYFAKNESQQTKTND